MKIASTLSVTKLNLYKFNVACSRCVVYGIFGKYRYFTSSGFPGLRM